MNDDDIKKAMDDLTERLFAAMSEGAALAAKSEAINKRAVLSGRLLYTSPEIRRIARKQAALAERYAELKRESDRLCELHQK